ncbi:MAG: hypothetical protein ABEJ72_04860, partial [Candidatus Aenigmatarchaeota archaeon]
GGVDSETYRVVTRVERDAEEIYSGLYQREISLPSFKDVSTNGFVESEHLLSGKTGFGFETSFSGDEMRFQGKGPTTIRFKFGKGKKSEYFMFFGQKPDNTEDAYTVPVGTLGIVQGFRRFPVAVMNDSDYDKAVNQWSAGEYTGGVIRIRTPESIDERFIPVLGHEVVHGLNDRVLNWDGTKSSYFDEGIAKYVEYTIQKKLYSQERIDRPPAELFGEEVRYDPDPTDRSYYTIGPAGDPDKLWNYYQDEREFMKNWNALEASKSTREFGYAYSELIVRNYIANMNGSVRNIYSKMDFNQRITDPQVKWEFYGQFMDMTPCKYPERQRFNQCLDRINSYNYPVYSAEPKFTDQQLEINRLEIPNRTGTEPPLETIGKVD